MTPLSLKNVERLAAELCKIAREAGVIILEIYKENLDDMKVKMKRDVFGAVSPLTKADLYSSNLICSMLKEFDSKIPIVIEEREAEMEPYEKRKHYEYYWCIDPLDGTKEFIKRNGQFTVNIGLIYKDKPIFGVVYVPTLDVMYYGGTLDKYGAWKESKDSKPERLQVATFSMSDENLTVAVSASHQNEATLNFVKQFKNPSLRVLGSSLKLLMVAEGTAHVYPRIGRTCEWDTAASHAIVNAAGGSVIIYEKPEEGRVLRYNKKSHKNPYFVVWGNVKGGCDGLKERCRKNGAVMD